MMIAITVCGDIDSKNDFSHGLILERKALSVTKKSVNRRSGSLRVQKITDTARVLEVYRHCALEQRLGSIESDLGSLRSLFV